jgi:hypothetical protein
MCIILLLQNIANCAKSLHFKYILYLCKSITPYVNLGVCRGLRGVFVFAKKQLFVWEIILYSSKITYFVKLKGALTL